MKIPFSRILPPLSIWILGITSGLINLSNLMVFSLIGVYSLHVLELSPIIIGLIEGIVDFFSWIVRLLAGSISDYFKKRKSIIIFGYILFISSRIMLLLMHTGLGVTFARLTDRSGYGVQSAPREALVADLSPPNQKGTNYGLRHALSIIGSVLGAFAATYILKTTGNNYDAVFWFALIPGILALILLIKYIRDPLSLKQNVIHRIPIHLQDFKSLGGPYWRFIFITFLFTLSHYSPVFLSLQADAFGLKIQNIPLIMAFYSIIEVLLSYPAGILSDYTNRKVFVFLGFIALAAANYALGFAGNLEYVFLGLALWGVQLGLTKGIFHTMVADFAPSHLRATAFGLFYLMTGSGYFISNILSGWLSSIYDLSFMFLIKGHIGILSILILLIMKIKKLF